MFLLLHQMTFFFTYNVWNKMWNYSKLLFLCNEKKNKIPRSILFLCNLEILLIQYRYAKFTIYSPQPQRLILLIFKFEQLPRNEIMNYGTVPRCFQLNKQKINSKNINMFIIYTYINSEYNQQ